MKNKKLFVYIIIFLIIVLAVIVYFKNKDFKDSDNIKIVEYDNLCVSSHVEKTVNGDSMEPLISSGETLILLEDYYNCNEVKRGDVVAYARKQNKNPLIKKVLVLPGDELEFKINQSNTLEANLLVNGQMLENSVGEAYQFSEKQKKLISLYIKDGELVENAYLIFGEDVLGSLDSRKFGAVGKNGFVGKFEVN